MDGHFVPNITMGAPVLASVHKTVDNVFMDCHMMVSDPEKVGALALLLPRSHFDPADLLLDVPQWVKPVAEAGGKSYTFHIEALANPGACPLRLGATLFQRHKDRSEEISRCCCGGASRAHADSASDLVDLIHANNMRSAVAISPSTPSSAISDSLGQKVDMLLVMTVVPGKGGQKFMPECVVKVAELRKRFPDKDIQVDGGVGPGTVGCCARAGACPYSFVVATFSSSSAEMLILSPSLILSFSPEIGSNVIVAGTALFGAGKPAEVITDFKRQVDESRTAWGADETLDEARKLAKA